jgi:hypothetical protein
VELLPEIIGRRHFLINLVLRIIPATNAPQIVYGAASLKLRVDRGASDACDPRPPNWQVQIRQRVAAQQLGAALAIADRRLAQAPQDLVWRPLRRVGFPATPERR